MRKFVRLAACMLLAALLFSSCGSRSGGAVESNARSNGAKDEMLSAYEKLNKEERALFDQLTGPLFQAFYDDASEVRIKKIYKIFTGPQDEEGTFSVLADLEGTGKLSGALSREHAILASLEDGPLSIEYGDIPEPSQPVPEDEMDPVKINAALKEYWNAGMHAEEEPPADEEESFTDEEEPFADEEEPFADEEEPFADEGTLFADEKIAGDTAAG